MLTLDFNLKFGRSGLSKWIVLGFLSLLYRFLVELWLFLYRSGLKNAYHCHKPLISVGNITVGGTGKTPLIDWFLTFCAERNLSAAVLTRGYKSDDKRDLKILDQQTASTGNARQFGDEPWLLFKSHPQALFYIGADRVDSARQAAEKADLLLLDDGMQQLRIDRSLNIVLIDSLSGIGNGKLLPLGPLREPLRSLARADIVIYNRSDLVAPAAIREQITPFLKPGTESFCAEFLPETLVSSRSGKILTSRELARKRCLLFSGIGNPQSFALTVQQTTAVIADHLVFEDHCRYDAKELSRLRRFIQDNTHDFVICTEKDWVKLEEHRFQLPEFWHLKMKLKLEQGFGKRIESLLAPFFKAQPAACPDQSGH